MYLDDINIFSKIMDEHILHVEEVLCLFLDSGAPLKLSRSHFSMQSLDSLGHVIRPDLLRIATKNTEAIREAIPPSTQTQIRSSLGMCNVYGWLVPEFS